MNKISFIFLITSFFQMAVSGLVQDYSQFYRGTINALIKPRTVKELQSIVATHSHISIRGANYSMGGHTWCNHGVVIDMGHFNKVLHFDRAKKTITVQTGMSWKNIQEFLAPYNLTIKVMQSYNNFSVGGSLSVNVHGRDPNGPLVTTVRSLRILLANGSIIQASTTENKDLFSAAIGGYGACGIILDVTLDLEDNYPITRSITKISTENFLNFYNSTIANNPNVTFFNGNLYGPNFDTVVNFTWHKTNKPLTCDQKLQSIATNPFKKAISKSLEYAISRSTVAQKVRSTVETNPLTSPVVWRSHEMSHSITTLAPHWSYASKILQEYFVPVEHFNEFVQAMKTIIKKYDIKILNISIRHVHKNTQSLLTYAPHDCFAFVCYIVVPQTLEDIHYAQQWTQKLIDAALEYKGTYYLPYHTFARPDQFLQAYPHAQKFLQVKHIYDPTDKFTNNFLHSIFNAVKIQQ